MNAGIGSPRKKFTFCSNSIPIYAQLQQFAQRLAKSMSGAIAIDADGQPDFDHTAPKNGLSLGQ
ncbi:MAG: hypothetical protein AAGA70_12785 [Pseudomonadota bacterium]